MKRFGTGMLAAVFAVAMAQAAIACDKDAKGGCSKTQAATAAAVSTDSNVVDQGVDQVMASLPKMTYRVGSLDTPCCKTAREAAAKTNEPIQYVVAGETYGCRETAMNKLAEQIQAELPKVATVAHVVDGEALNCPKTAAKLAAERNAPVKHMVAGVTFDCPQQAQQVADRLAAKLASSHGCAKAFAEGCAKSGEATTASVTEGGCSKTHGTEAKVASGEAAHGGCSKSKAAAETASAKTGGCSKSEGAEAKTAAAGEAKGGCCSKSKAAAETASAKTGGCSKSEGAEAKTASAGEAKGGCCSKSKAAAAAAQTAAADTKDAAEAGATAEAGAEETPQLANAKLLVREIVEFVAASRNS